MKKRKIIVTVVSLILVCTMVTTCVVALLTNTSSVEDETHSQTNETTDTTNMENSPTEETEDIVVPPIEESTEKPPVDKPLLDVGDMVSDPNPSVVDSKIEYGTKEVENNAE